MATSAFVQYIGDGSTRVFPITFSYLGSTHIKAELNTVTQEVSVINGGASVEFTVAPSVGVTITIFRETPKVPLIDFNESSILKEADLDLSLKQSIYVAEESFASNIIAIRKAEEIRDLVEADRVEVVANLATVTSLEASTTSMQADVLTRQNDVIARQTDVANKNIDVTTKHTAVTVKHAQVLASQADVTTRQADVSAKHATVLTSQADVTTRQAGVTASQVDVTSKHSNIIVRQSDVTTRQVDVATKHTAVLASQVDVTTRQADVTTRQADVTARQAAVVVTQGEIATTVAAEKVNINTLADTRESGITTLADNRETALNSLASGHENTLNVIKADVTLMESNVATLESQTQTAASTGAVLLGDTLTAEANAATSESVAVGAASTASTKATEAAASLAAASQARDVTQGYRDEAEQFAAIATSEVVFLGVRDVSAGDAPSPQSNGFYRITGSGVMNGITVSAGDELFYELGTGTWVKIGRDILKISDIDDLRSELDEKAIYNQLDVVSAVLTDINLSVGNNFAISLDKNITISLVGAELNIGKSGLIVLMQDGVGGRRFTLPTKAKTPMGGAAIVQLTAPNTTSALSYYVVSATIVLVNYIGDYA